MDVVSWRSGRVLVAALIPLVLLRGQETVSEGDLRALANARLRNEVIERIAGGGGGVARQLLARISTPPGDVYLPAWKTGLIRVFGRMRSREAIPFLLDHLTIQEGLGRPVIGLKSRTSLMEYYPAAKALIDMGPDALEAVGERLRAPITRDERILCLLIAGGIGGPRALAILNDSLKTSRFETSVIEREIDEAKAKR